MFVRERERERPVNFVFVLKYELKNHKAGMCKVGNFQMIHIFKVLLIIVFVSYSDLLSSEYVERYVEHGGKTVEVKVSKIVSLWGRFFENF